MKNKLSVQVGIMISVFLVMVMAAVEGLMIASATGIFLRSKNDTFNRDLRLLESGFHIVESVVATLDYISDNTEFFRTTVSDEELAEIIKDSKVFSYGSSNDEFRELSDAAKHYYSRTFYETMNFVMAENMQNFNYEHVFLFEIKNGDPVPTIVIEGRPEWQDLDFGRLGGRPDIDLRNSEMMRFMTSGNTDDDTHYEIIGDGYGNVYYAGYRRFLPDAQHTYVLCAFYNWSSFRDRILSSMIPATIVFVAIIAVANVLIVSFIYFKAVKPVTAIQKSVRGYTETRDTARIAEDLSKITAKNEFGTLAGDVSRLTGEIELYTKESARLATELDLAARIQISSLPSQFPAFPDRKEFDIFASMDPAKEVGGDFYDFFMIDKKRLAVLIADVSGKGVPAALFMMASKILIDDHSLYAASPADVISAVNQRICSNNVDMMFVTVWLGFLDLGTGKLTCCNAGHEYPAIKRAGGQFELLTDKHFPAVGVLPGVRYKDYEITLGAGDTVFVYTDGVPEATDASETLYGNERMINALNSVRDVTPAELLAAVRKDIDAFVGDAPQFDDLTMLALKYFGKDPE